MAKTFTISYDFLTERITKEFTDPLELTMQLDLAIETYEIPNSSIDVQTVNK